MSKLTDCINKNCAGTATAEAKTEHWYGWSRWLTCAKCEQRWKQHFISDATG